MIYSDFIARKLAFAGGLGIDPDRMPDSLFDFQSALTAWALRRGRAAIFADTGLGKTRMQLAWGAHIPGDTLILAPLAVAEQTVAEGAAMGVAVNHCRDKADVVPGINITNYERLHRFDPSRFAGVILDESSIIKHHDSKTLSLLLEAFARTEYKLCATATPSPNDWTELGTHAEFLGVCTRSEMLSEFFVHDGGETQVWRLKGHARQAFWRWVSSWGAMVKSPADLGFDGSRFELPPKHVHQHIVECTTEAPIGLLFAMEAQTLSERRDARRHSMKERVSECAALIKGEWFKLAETIEHDDALEEGIRSESQAEIGERSGISGEAECAIDDGQSGASPIHEGLLLGEPGEVPEANARATGEVQRISTKKIRGTRSNARGSEESGEGVADCQPQETPCATSEEIRPNASTVRFDDDVAIGRLRDLQDQGEGLPDDRPLSLDGARQRAAVYAVQPGDRETEGQRNAAAGGHQVPKNAWLIWCELNSEQDALEREFGKNAFSVRGADSTEDKERSIRGWLAGERPVMISKPSIMGFGLNFQHCADMAFVGVTDSFEAYYQAVRRCWRFGQTKPVNVHVFTSELEGAVLANLRRKEEDAREMGEQLAAETAAAVRENVLGMRRESNIYAPKTKTQLPGFMNGH